MKTALRVLISIMLLAAVLWWVQPQAALSAIVRPHPGWLALSIGALVAQIGLSALRWQVTAGALGQTLPRLWAVQEYALSVAANTFLPGGVLGDLGRIFRSRDMGWQGRGWRGAAASVVVERLAGQIAMIGVMLVALPVWLGSTGAAFALLVAGGFGTVLWIWPKLRGLLAQAWCAAGVWPMQLALTLAILLANLLGFWAAAQSVGVTLPASAALVLIPGTLLAMLLPLSLNGWGLREGVAATLWPLWGIAAPQAVTASIQFGLACMAAALLGLLPLLLKGRARQRPKKPI
jgi:hypothetical protein